MDKPYKINEKDIESALRWLKINDPENATREKAEDMLKDLKAGFHGMSHNNPDLLIKLQKELRKEPQAGKSPDICPFGPELQKYWDRRYKFFSKFDEGIQIDEEGLFSVIPEGTGLEQAKLIRGHRVLDGFAGVGGTSIAYARSGKEVIAVEIDKNRIGMVENNAAVYDVSDKITFVNGDFFEVAPTIHADTVVLDPPWGGPSYKELGVFRLVNFEAKSQTAKAVDGAAMLRLSLEHFNEVLLRVPTNFDISELDAYNVPYEVHDDRMDDRIICRSVVFRKNS